MTSSSDFEADSSSLTKQGRKTSPKHGEIFSREKLAGLEGVVRGLWKGYRSVFEPVSNLGTSTEI